MSTVKLSVFKVNLFLTDNIGYKQYSGEKGLICDIIVFYFIEACD